MIAAKPVFALNQADIKLWPVLLERKRNQPPGQPTANNGEITLDGISHKAAAFIFVIPAKAGIHILKRLEFMDSRLRGNDGLIQRKPTLKGI